MKLRIEAAKKEFMSKLDYWKLPYEVGFDKGVELCAEIIAAKDAEIKEHEAVGLVVYGRKIEVLNKKIRDLESELRKNCVCGEINARNCSVHQDFILDDEKGEL